MISAFDCGYEKTHDVAFLLYKDGISEFGKIFNLPEFAFLRNFWRTQTWLRRVFGYAGCGAKDEAFGLSLRTWVLAITNAHLL